MVQIWHNAHSSHIWLKPWVVHRKMDWVKRYPLTGKWYMFNNFTDTKIWRRLSAKWNTMVCDSALLQKAFLGTFFVTMVQIWLNAHSKCVGILTFRTIQTNWFYNKTIDIRTLILHHHHHLSSPSSIRSGSWLSSLPKMN